MKENIVGATARVVVSMELELSGANYGPEWRVGDMHKDAVGMAEGLLSQIRGRFPSAVRSAEIQKVLTITYERTP